MQDGTLTTGERDDADREVDDALLHAIGIYQQAMGRQASSRDDGVEIALATMGAPISA